jgi:hypothetical protein
MNENSAEHNSLIILPTVLGKQLFYQLNSIILSIFEIEIQSTIKQIINNKRKNTTRNIKHSKQRSAKGRKLRESNKEKALTIRLNERAAYEDENFDDNIYFSSDDNSDSRSDEDVTTNDLMHQLNKINKGKLKRKKNIEDNNAEQTIDKNIRKRNYSEAEFLVPQPSKQDPTWFDNM